LRGQLGKGDKSERTTYAPSVLILINKNQNSQPRRQEEALHRQEATCASLAFGAKGKRWLCNAQREATMDNQQETK